MMRVYLALGSNVGDRGVHLASARGALRAGPALGGVLWCSGEHETEPVGGPAGQGLFLNQAVGLETAWSPRRLLGFTQGLERAAGRAAVGERVKDGPRALDVDVLLWGDEAIDEPGLRVPHPRMCGRLFVLEPLSEIAGGLVVPGTGRTVSAWRAACAGA